MQSVFSVLLAVPSQKIAAGWHLKQLIGCFS
jgi:hypothetical protein